MDEATGSLRTYGYQTVWVRRSYEIESRTGYIRPVKGSPQRPYDPFNPDADIVRDDPDVPLHEDLAALRLRSWAHDPSEEYGPPPAEDPEAAAQRRRKALAESEEIRRFTSKWGLLGLFQHNLLEARYSLEPEGEDFRGYGNDILVIDRPGEPVTIVRPSPFGPPTPAPEVRDQTWWAPLDPGWGTAVVTVEQGGSTEVLPVRTYYERYLLADLGTPSLAAFGPPKASAPPDSGFPSLGSDRLWDSLCEPVWLFRDAVTEFQDAMNQCAREDLSPSEAEELRMVLQRHASRVRTVVEWRPNLEHGVDGIANRRKRGYRPSVQWESRWAFPSLLSAAYMLLLLDLTKGHVVRNCARADCRRIFRATRPDRIYCSPRCLNAQKQREHRHREQG